MGVDRGMKVRLRRTYCLPSNMFVRFLSDISVKKSEGETLKNVGIFEVVRFTPVANFVTDRAPTIPCSHELDVPVDDCGQLILPRHGSADRDGLPQTAEDTCTALCDLTLCPHDPFRRSNSAVRGGQAGVDTPLLVGCGGRAGRRI